MSLKDQILATVNETPGLTDREITDRIRGISAIQQPINQACRALVYDGLVSRERNRPHDNLIGNYLSDGHAPRNFTYSPILSKEVISDWQPRETSERVEYDGYEFEKVCDIDPLRDAAGDTKALFPQSRYAQADKANLHKYGQGPFCKFKIPRGINLPGVYALAIGQSLKYIGECENLSKRYNAQYGNIPPRACFAGGRETDCRVNNLLYAASVQSTKITLWFYATHDHKMVERKLLLSLDPPWNLR